MKIEMTLFVPEPEDIDEENVNTGLTEAAYNRLYDAVTDAGFEFDDGPTKVRGS